jgi:hypothetical protein
LLSVPGFQVGKLDSHELTWGTAAPSGFNYGWDIADLYVAQHNAKPKPFIWTASARTSWRRSLTPPTAQMAGAR